MSTPVTRYIDAGDGVRIHITELGSPDAERTIVVVHGYDEHGERYIERLSPMAEAGYRVLIPDVRGHGRSGGRRGHVMRFDEFLDDVDRVLELVETPAERTGLLGHSNGGLISIAWALRDASRVGAVAVTSPFLGVALEPPKWKLAAASLLSRIAPKVSLPTEIKAEMVSHDPAVVAAYADDPLGHRIVNARFFAEATKSADEARARAATLSVPMLVMQAGDDLIVSAAATRSWAKAAPAEMVTYEEIPGAYHELLFELDGAQHAARIHAYFNEQLS